MSLHIYPLTKTAESVQHYTLRINGVPVTPDTARVSAVPYNRRWPGHQRSIDQTELVNFVSFAADEALDFEITPPTPVDRVVVRPLSLGITPTVENGVIRFRMEKPAYCTVEPYGRHDALHIFADPMPTYADVNPDDPNVLYYGPGFHDAGIIDLKSGQTLFIDEGAVVYACVTATDAENIAILGRGILDNSRNKEEILFEANVEGNDEAVENAFRRHTIQPEYCTNVRIEGITIRDSLVYNIRPVGCRNLDIRNVKAIGCWRYNADGIDMHNCENVRIDHCFLRVFDDAICIKGFDCFYEKDVDAAVRAALYHGGQTYDVFRNVHITDITIWNDWGKSLEIGAETKGREICDVLYENCRIIHVCASPIDCMSVDDAEIHDLTWRNIDIEYDEVIPQPCIQQRDDVRYEDVPRNADYAPPLICAHLMFHHEYSRGSSRLGRIRHLRYENIRLTGRQPITVHFNGWSAESDLRDISIRGLYHNGERITQLPDEQMRIGPYCSGIVLE